MNPPINIERKDDSMDLQKLKQQFKERYGTREGNEAEEIRTFFAPGRVNLIGEHIDYNGGKVFPCALNFGTYALVRKRGDQVLRFASTNFSYQQQISLDSIEYNPEHDWINYPKGVIKYFQEAGCTLGGLDILYAGNIPNGAGLSSSASIEVVTAVFLNTLFDCKMSMIHMIQISQKAENHFVGVNSGIMDQFAVGMGKVDHAILLDCSTLDYQYVPLQLQGAKLIIANTKKRRGLADSKYNERRSECETALEDLQKELNIQSLGELDIETFEQHKNRIQNPIHQKRATHAVYENIRVQQAVEKLNQGDVQTFGKLMNESHVSLRDLYEVTGVELDTMVEEAWKVPGVIGSRMTGAGFGGCTISIVKEEAIPTFIQQVGINYEKKTGLKPEFYIAEVGQGAREIIAYHPAKDIERLLIYGQHHQLLEKEDVIPVRNALLDLFHLSEPYQGNLTEEEQKPLSSPMSILNPLLDYAVDAGLIPDHTTTQRDLFDARVMGLLMPRQSEVVRTFYQKAEKESMEKATDYFYQLSQASNYIRMDRIANNKYWKVSTDFGELEITINVSKPEKDPKEIAAAKVAPKGKYPQCFLCIDNVGYAGRINHPARQNHRIIPLTLDQEDWYLQYSPYVYYNEHSILLHGDHVPMQITKKTFIRILDFLSQFPHYFVGSNADLPIVGGSILSHDHFQGGRHCFPMEVAPMIQKYQHPQYPKVQAGIVHWPLSVIRLQSKDKESLIQLAYHILQVWREYSDPSVDILAYTQEGDQSIPHNTITPIGRVNEKGEYELDLVLRNNRRTEQYPDGIFHPHPHLHHIKKENIGLIEVMGLAVLPGRLATELERVQDLLTGKTTWNTFSTEEQKQLEKHRLWAKELIEIYGTGLDEKQAKAIVQKEVGIKFAQVLQDAGVYKQNQQGQKAFQKFMEQSGLHPHSR